jgi:choline dehydrogenase
MRPWSRGTLRLADADPASAPVIETGYFDEPGDLRDAVGACRFAAEIAGADTMRPYRGARAIPGNVSDGEVADFIPHSGRHILAPMRDGPDGRRNDNGAVVDAELRVRGVEKLRVADASVLRTRTVSRPNRHLGNR